MTRACITCGKDLYFRNKSGYCAKHSNLCPEKRARAGETLRKAIAANPELREHRRRGGRLSASPPGERERRSKLCSERRLWEIGSAARTPDSFAKIARSTSERRMAWCPPELRDEARHLVKSKNMKLAEVKEIILAQHETSMRRFVQRITPVPAANTAPTPAPAEIEAPPPIDPNLPVVERATAIASWKLGTTPEAVRSMVRTKPEVRTRWAVMIRLREQGVSYPEIARLVGIRDHSSVIYGVREAERLAQRDPVFAEALELARAA